MNTNSKQSTDKTHSGAVCRGIAVLLGLFAFIWLPTAAVDAALLLKSPPDCKTPDNLDLCDATDAVTVFRWTRSEDSRVHSYRVIFSENPGFEDPLFQDGIIPELPEPNDEKIFAPQAALNLVNGPFFSFTPYYWRVVALDESGNVVEEGQETFAFYFKQDGSGFTVISGLVKSDLNQASLVGAQVAVSSARHTTTTDTTNSIATTVFNGEYIVIALTTDSNGDPISFPIEITSTKEGFQTAVVDDLKESEKVNGVITRDLLMRNDLPFSSSLRLISPPDCQTSDPPPCGRTDKVTVFRWTENPLVHSYRVIFSDLRDFSNGIKLELPESDNEKIIAPQVAVDLANSEWKNFYFFNPNTSHYWRVIGLDQTGDPVEQSQETFAFFYIDDPSGFTVISGLVKSDLNQAGLVGAQVAVSSDRHTGTRNTTNRITEAKFNGEYFVIALTTDINGDPIDFPIKITSTKVGYKPTVVEQADERVNGVITLNLEMIKDSDGDGLRALPHIPLLLLSD